MTRECWLSGDVCAGQPAAQSEDLEALYGGLLPSTPERELTGSMVPKA